MRQLDCVVMLILNILISTYAYNILVSSDDQWDWEKQQIKEITTLENKQNLQFITETATHR